MSAVSNRFTPASRHISIWRLASAPRVLPIIANIPEPPKVIAPKLKTETLRPLRPSSRYCMLFSIWPNPPGRLRRRAAKRRLTLLPHHASIVGIEFWRDLWSFQSHRLRLRDGAFDRNKRILRLSRGPAVSSARAALLLNVFRVAGFAY